MPTASTTVMAAMADSAPTPLLMAQRSRPTGVVSSISSRPDVSSEAQPPTIVAAAKPTTMNPNWMNRS